MENVMANTTSKGAHAVAGRVRAARAEDAKAVAEIYAPYVRDTLISFETVPPDDTEMARRIAKVLPNLPWLVYEDDGLPVGYAYASQHRERAAYRWSVDVGIYIAPQAHRRGVGRMLYAVLLAALRMQGYHRAYGGITLPNAASVGLHEAMGFSAIGVYREVGFKFGAWRDVGWWGLALSPTSHVPSEPLPFTKDICDAAMRAVGGSR
jgi:phosphinothricin acetyltransferase